MLKTEMNMTLPDILSCFSYGHYRIELEAVTPITLPPDKGSALRGVLGRGLRKVCCSDSERMCAECPDGDGCAYAYLFETPPEMAGEDFRNMKHHDMPKAPHPYVLRPPRSGRRHYQAGEHLTFEIILIGRAAMYFPQVAAAVVEAGIAGMGKNREGSGRFHIDRIDTAPPFGSRTFGELAGSDPSFSTDPDAPSLAGRQCTLRLLTPLQIKENYTWLRFGTLFANLRRRICSLAALHCSLDCTILERDSDLMAAADRITTRQSDLSVCQWNRYSSPQQKKHNMQGLSGRLDFEGDFSNLWPFLRLGEIIHAGKKTTFGFGQYAVSFA